MQHNIPPPPPPDDSLYPTPSPSPPPPPLCIYLHLPHRLLPLPPPPPSSAIMKSFEATSSDADKPDKFLAYMVPAPNEVRGDDADDPTTYAVAFGETEAHYMLIKPTILIGSSGTGKTFTNEVVQAMATFNKKSVIFALSNPTSQSECTAEEAYTWSHGRAIFASGGPFAPVEYKRKLFMSGLGLGLIISGAIRVHDDMLLAASEALAAEVSKDNFEKGLIYPPFANIYKEDFSSHCC
ncbi:hypothetical protein T459_11026 [Capsicum annuum]|uniref:Malic enzyme NAD-binding domain-containing protein n=1 Tax=Capsicum annuum TaxID=4072 RepID=A0A2G3A404_CAPAN|nr:hypothetical protein T459_11026 [Capsicum annuum]